MAGDLLWSVERLRQAYPGVVANDGVSLELRAGEIHALLGENGCGKSTLIKTLAGAHRTDTGVVRRSGQAVELTSPIRARELRIATVFQEFSLVGSLTVAETIALGCWPGRAVAADWPAMRSAALRALERIEVAIDPGAVTGDLSVARQQQVGIAKAIAADADLIILDEPTTALGPPEIAHLHALLRRLKAQGRAILDVSHRLDEVTALVDVATVMRGGRVVSDARTTPIAVDAFVRAMVGEVGEHDPKQRRATSEPLLEVHRIATAAGVHDMSFTLHRGEVLGLGGVLGSGRTAIARALFGLDPLTRGTVRLAAREVRFGGPKDAIAAGLALLTENRKADGLFFNVDGPKNVTIANLEGSSRRGIVDLGAEQEVARRFIDKLQITGEAVVRPAGLLSGGNQQKVIIARWLYTGAPVLIFDEPTQGIDIAAKIAVYRLIDEIPVSGAGVILISADDEELLAIVDRIALVRHGRVTRVVAAALLDRAELVQSSDREAA